MSLFFFFSLCLITLQNTQRICFYDHTYEKGPTVKDTPCSLTRCSLILLMLLLNMCQETVFTVCCTEWRFGTFQGWYKYVCQLHRKQFNPRKKSLNQFHQIDFDPHVTSPNVPPKPVLDYGAPGMTQHNLQHVFTRISRTLFPQRSYVVIEDLSVPSVTSPVSVLHERHKPTFEFGRTKTTKAQKVN